MNQSVAGFHHSERGLLSFNLSVLDGFLDFLLFWGVFSLTSSGSIISTLHLIRRRIFVSTGHTFKHISTTHATDVLWNQDQSPYINFKTHIFLNLSILLCVISLRQCALTFQQDWRFVVETHLPTSHRHSSCSLSGLSLSSNLLALLQSISLLMLLSTTFLYLLICLCLFLSEQ